MISSSAIESSPILIEKMNIVLRMFRQKKTDFEIAAANVPDASLKNMILTLAQESNQYAAEWQSQIQTLGGKAEGDPEDVQIIADGGLNDDSDILLFCDSNENKMVNAYKEILDLPELYEGVKKMINYQLEGIHSAFMQFRLLGKLTPFSL